MAIDQKPPMPNFGPKNPQPPLDLEKIFNEERIDLKALMDSGPVLVGDDWYGDSYYVRVANVPDLPEVADDGAGPDSPKRGHVFQIPVTMHKWVTSGTGITP